jgi:hypothetical protein
MPATAAAAFIAVLLVPGFLLVRGYRGRDPRLLPERDFYAVAEAVVASVVWLGAIWLIQYFLGDSARTWGILPFEQAVFEDHAAPAVAFGLIIVLVPYGVGLVGSRVVAWLASQAGQETRLGRRLVRLAGRYDLLVPQTAWERAWRSFHASGAGEVVVRLKDGSLIRGAYGSGSQVDFATPQVLLTSGYEESLGGDTGKGVEDAASAVIRRQEATDGSKGVFIEASEISAIFFKEPLDG